MRFDWRLVAGALWLVCSACGSSSASDAPLASHDAASAAMFADLPLSGATSEQLADFARGDALFELSERPADGLGPLYANDSCGACHRDAARGPGSVQKMSVVDDDGVTPSDDQSLLAFGHTVRPLLVSPATTAIEPPANTPSVRVTLRMGPPVLGRGYLEAIADSELERVAALQAASGGAIRGRVNHVPYASKPNPDSAFFNYRSGQSVIGRFGIKARIATLDDFTADALVGDMGLTNPLRPRELLNPDGLLDDQKPGVDSSADSVNQRAMYLRLIEIPERGSGNTAGAALFESTQCATCHVPSLHTRADYPIAALADIDAPVYTDLLLHDMGDALADGMADGVDGEAHSRDFRSAPLIGLRFSRIYLHDGRAPSLSEAISMHQGEGSEANDSVARFHALSAADQRALLAFVGSL